MSVKYFTKNEDQNRACINMSKYKVNDVYHVYVSDKKYHKHLNVLHLSNEIKEHIKNFR